MNERQRRFVDEYIICGVPETAMVRAGYSPNYARKEAYARINAPEIQDYLKERMAALASEKIATQEEVLEHLTAAMRGEIEEEAIVVEGTGDGHSSARKIKKEIGARERLKAAELLGKRHRLFTDRVEVDPVLPVIIKGEDDLE